jgi:threonyl-tRNA synthetase
MATIAITVDGSARNVESDQRPTHIFAEDKSIVVARVNGELRDLHQMDSMSCATQQHT